MHIKMKIRNMFQKFDLILAIGICLLVLFFILLCWVNFTQSRAYIDSDASSELLLSKLLLQEKSLISTNWYYSTEIRLFNTQIITAPLFLFFDDWSVIRAISNAILYILLILSYIFFTKQLKIKMRWIILTSSFLLIPFSDEITHIVHLGAYYIPHICLLFLYLGMYIKLQNCENKKARTILMVFLLIIAFVYGMSGIRYVFMLFIPLLFTCFWSYLSNHEFNLNINTENIRGNKLLIISFALVLLSFAGYIVNDNVLNSIYHFKSFEHIKMISLKESGLLTQISSVLGGLLQIFGYRNDVKLFSFSGINNLFMILLITIVILIIIKLMKSNLLPEQSFIVRFAIVSFLLHSFAFCFTNIINFDQNLFRYYIVSIIMFIPIIAVYLNIENSKMFKLIISVLIILPLIFSSVKSLETLGGKNTIGKDTDKASVETFLEENDYTFGYATFWNANVLTELSDGKIEVANMLLHDLTKPYLWLSPKKYYSREYHKGKCFLLLTKDELDTCLKNKNKNLINKGKPVYSDQIYIVYSYDNNHLFTQ